MKPSSLNRRKHQDTRGALRHLTRAVHKLSHQVQELRRDMAVAKQVSREVFLPPDDPIQARIDQIEQRLSVERGQR